MISLLLKWTEAAGLEESVLRRRDHWLNMFPVTGPTPCPLIITVHGGGQKDYGQLYETSVPYSRTYRSHYSLSPDTSDGVMKFESGPEPSGDIIYR